MRKLFNNRKQKNLRRDLRNEMPKAELLVWNQLRSKQLGYKFRRQYGVGPYVVDFYCPALKVAIEIDGDSHFEEMAEEQDKQRQDFIESKGIIVVRFTNTDVYESLDDVIEIIEKLFPLTL